MNALKQYACTECGDADPECQECCAHDELDHGFCLDCGKEVDWVSRVFKDAN